MSRFTRDGQHNPPRPPTPKALRRVVAGATIGTALEWYDFFIYGTAAALVFGDLFFDPASGSGTLIAFATFGVGFVARPFGGMLFGHLGDRIGRRETLIITTLVMGLSTGAIGLLRRTPASGCGRRSCSSRCACCRASARARSSAARPRCWPSTRRGRAAVLLLVRPDRRADRLVLGTLSFLLVALLPDDQLKAWGWRVPFLLGFVLIAVALWVRLRVEESPVFKEVQRRQTVVKLPLVEAFKRYPRSVLVGIGAHVCDTAAAYMFATFTVAYAVDELGMSKGVVLGAVVTYGILVIFTQPLLGALSDRIGRRPLNLFGVIFTGLWAFPFFAWSRPASRCSCGSR